MDVYKVSEVAKILRITAMTVRKHLRSGAIPGGFNVGDTWRIDKDVFDKYMADKKLGVK